MANRTVLLNSDPTSTEETIDAVKEMLSQGKNFRMIIESVDNHSDFKQKPELKRSRRMFGESMSSFMKEEPYKRNKGNDGRLSKSLDKLIQQEKRNYTNNPKLVKSLDELIEEERGNHNTNQNNNHNNKYNQGQTINPNHPNNLNNPNNPNNYEYTSYHQVKLPLQEHEKQMPHGAQYDKPFNKGENMCVWGHKCANKLCSFVHRIATEETLKVYCKNGNNCKYNRCLFFHEYNLKN